MHYLNPGCKSKDYFAYLMLNLLERKNTVGGAMREDLIDTFIERNQ
jgi:hypothetical protein